MLNYVFFNYKSVITFESNSYCNDLIGWLDNRLGQKSCFVKLKVCLTAVLLWINYTLEITFDTYKMIFCGNLNISYNLRCTFFVCKHLFSHIFEADFLGITTIHQRPTTLWWDPNVCIRRGSLPHLSSERLLWGGDRIDSY